MALKTSPLNAQGDFSAAPHAQILQVKSPEVNRTLVKHLPVYCWRISTVATKIAN